MVNKKGGKSYKKAKKETQGDRCKPIVYKEEGEEYAIIKKMLGGGRVTLLMPDNTEKMGIIRGNMRRKGCWIVNNDLVLVSIRKFEEKKCDILFKYMPTHINILKKKEHLTSSFLNTLNNSNNIVETNEDNVIFDEEEDSIDEEVVDTKKDCEISSINTTNNESTTDNFDFDWDEI
jgi:translation initiation factor 1A